MEPARHGLEAAQTARDGSLLDDLTMKNMQLESLLVVLMHAIQADAPRHHLESTCWLACDMAEGLGATLCALVQSGRPIDTGATGRCELL